MGFVLIDDNSLFIEIEQLGWNKPRSFSGFFYIDFSKNDEFLCKSTTGNSLLYQHWTYQRYTGTSLATGSTPITSGSVSKLSECWDLCGTTSACAAFLYDENTSICSIFENTHVDNVTKNQIYFVVRNRVQYSDALSKTFR